MYGAHHEEDLALPDGERPKGGRAGAEVLNDGVRKDEQTPNECECGSAHVSRPAPTKGTHGRAQRGRSRTRASYYTVHAHTHTRRGPCPSSDPLQRAPQPTLPSKPMMNHTFESRDGNLAFSPAKQKHTASNEMKKMLLQRSSYVAENNSKPTPKPTHPTENLNPKP